MLAKSEFSRREFLSSVWNLFWVYMVAGFGADWLARKAISPEGESVKFSTAAADYTLIGGTHGIYWDEGTQFFGGRVSPDLLSSDTDAVVLEFSDPYLFSGKPKDVFANWSDRPFSHDLMEVISKNRADCLIVDVPISLSIGTLARWPIEAPAIGVGLEWLRRTLAAENTHPLLDAVGVPALGWIASGDFVSPALELANNLQPANHSAGVINTAQAAVEYLNPQYFSLTLRNPAVAAKMPAWENYYTNLLGRRPHFAMLGGIGHFGLPGWFAAGRRECVNYLKTVYPKPVRNLIIEDQNALFASARLSFSPDGSLQEEFLSDDQLKIEFS